MADTAFTPPPLSSHEGVAPFVPPPVSSHEGPAVGSAPPELTTEERESGGATLPANPVFKPAEDLVEGVGSGVASTLLGAYHMIRSIPGVGDKLPAPSDFISHLANTPDSILGKVGHYGEQAAEYMVPETKVAEATKGAGMLWRMLAHGLTTGSIAGVQSGGDPGTAATMGAIGAAGVPASDLLHYLGTKFIMPNFSRGSGRAWKPTPNDSEFPDITPNALSEVKTYGKVIDKAEAPGELKGDYNEHLQPGGINKNSATEEAVSKLQGGLDQWVDRAESAGVRIKGDGAVKAVYNAIPGRVRVEDPDQVAAILNRVRKAYAGKSFTPSQFRDFLRTGNAGDSPFYNKSVSGQLTGELAGNPAAIDKALTDWQREELYKALDPEHDGAGPRDIQQRTGGVINLREAAERNRIRIQAEKPVTDAEGTGRLLTGGLAFKNPTKNIISPPTSLLHPFQGPTDAIIERLFRHAPEARPIPLPVGEYPAVNGPRYSAAEATAQRQLSASTYPSYGSEGKGGVTTPDTGVVNNPRYPTGQGPTNLLLEGPKDSILSKPRDPNSTDFNAWEDPRAREIIAPGETPHSWLPSAAGRPAAEAAPEARIISKRGEAVPATEKLTTARPLSTQSAVEYLHRAGWNGKSSGLTEEIIREARKQAVADGYRITNEVVK